MKRKELIRLLEQNGWMLEREGGNHTVYADGKEEEFIPRHREVKEGLARDIIIPANGNIFRARTRIFAVRQGRIGRRVLVAVRKDEPDAALRQKDRVGAENVFVRGYKRHGLKK